MTRRIDFINPFGTSAYDGLIAETLNAYAGEGTELAISHLRGSPPDIDYYYNKHLMETALFEHVMQSEAAGFDAVVIGCCYDPGLRVARELVDIPVVGPLEASMQMAAYFGHNYVVLTDHHKAVPYLEDLVRTSGLGGNCKGVRCINWWVKDMIHDPDAVARDTIVLARAILEDMRAELIIMGCTIVAGCYQRHLMKTGDTGGVTIVNPNLLALKMAEGLADLRQKGAYTLSRVGFYEQPKGHYREQFLAERRKTAEALGLGGSAKAAE